MEKKKLILIDGHSIVHRAYYGVPDLTNSRGMHTNAIYGFLNILFKALKEEHPAYLVIAFDEHAPTFRHALFAEYKGTRKPMDPELREQIPALREILEAMTIPCVSIPTIEADDILGTLALKASADGLDVDLISGDRDLLQIARENVRICIPTTVRGQTTTKYYHEKELLEEYHLTPSQFIDRKALMGDSSDNYPGVPKVGEKTATELIETYGSLDGVYEHLEEISKNAIRESLRENRDLAYLCRTLATIKTDCDFDFSYESAGTEHLFTSAAYELIKQYELKSFFPYFEEADKTVTMPEKKVTTFGDLTAWTEAVKAAGHSALGLSFGLEEGTLYGICAAGLSEESASLYYLQTVPGREREAAAALEGLLKEGLQVSLCDVKDDYRILGLDCKADLFDCIIGAYLVNPLKNDYDEESVALEYLQWTVKSRKERYGKRTLQEVSFADPDTLREDLCDRALISLKAAPLIRESLERRGMDRLMTDIEMPLSKVLYDMERVGIRVKRDDLTAFSKELEEGITVLEKRIYEEAGEEFNIQSPKQLGVILFEKLGLPGGKKTKSGYSTAADVLEKLAGQSPIVLDILEYRALSKLKSTYADGLPAFIGPDERIHCRFNQTVTAT
ncbi:MAG: DNA polymerase I, partial [Lachnospiraceae bacterium]|nr:DNA polymerase I [Lachnospiraceae bacterium]